LLRHWRAEPSRRPAGDSRQRGGRHRDVYSHRLPWLVASTSSARADDVFDGRVGPLGQRLVASAQSTHRYRRAWAPRAGEHCGRHPAPQTFHRAAAPSLYSRRSSRPRAVATFSILWIVLRPAPARSYEVISLGVGVALVLAGGLVRGLSWTYLEGEDKGPLRAVGRLLLIVGVAVGCAPWWAAVLLGAVLVPRWVAGFRQAYAPTTVPVRVLA